MVKIKNKINLSKGKFIKSLSYRALTNAKYNIETLKFKYYIKLFGNTDIEIFTINILVLVFIF